MREHHNFVWRMEQIKESLPSESPLAKQINNRIAKAQLEAEGPQGLVPLVSGKEALQSLMDALSVIEFLSTFRTECEAKVISLEMLYKAVTWPTENDILPELYISFLRCVLLDQVCRANVLLLVKDWRGYCCNMLAVIEECHYMQGILFILST